MIIQGGANITGSAGVTRGYPTKKAVSVPTAGKSEFARNFDSVSFSNADAGNTYALELKGQLTQEVRTATSSDKVAALREQVQNGTYQVDAREIAKKMLLLGDI